MSEKAGLVKIKESKDDVMVVSANAMHPEVVAHVKYKTVGEVEEKERKREERKKEEEEKVVSMKVEELWKPVGSTVVLFEAKGKEYVSSQFLSGFSIVTMFYSNSTNGLYTASDVRTLLNNHITTSNPPLIHPAEQAYIIPDDLLLNVLRNKKNENESMEFVKRSDLLQLVLEEMQVWHRLGNAPAK